MDWWDFYFYVFPSYHDNFSADITSYLFDFDCCPAVSIRDKEDMIFGGSDAPAALGCVYSLGSISLESNGSMMKSFAGLLEPFGVSADRMYVNFFDMPRENVGWNGRTFAG